MASGPEKQDENPKADASPVSEAGDSASADSARGQGSATVPASGDQSSEEADPGATGTPEESKGEGATFAGAHHDEYDQYHDEYHEEHFHDHDSHGNGAQDEHGDFHEDYHYHDHHYDDPQHSAYRQGGAALAAGAARSGPLDQRSVPNHDDEPELDDDGNPYGGPVKPFLDHLEDLRWVILKCVITMMIAMMGCMMGAKHLVSALIWPLKQAQSLGYSMRTDVGITLGDKKVGRIQIDAFGKLGMDTNSASFHPAKGGFELTPIKVGTNLVLAMAPRPVSKDADKIFGGIEDVMVELKNYGPFESIWLCLQLALYGGLVFGSPFIIFFIAGFVLPALKVSEKRFIYRASGVASILFFVGVAFCYFLIVQVALKASVEFSNWLGFGADEWKASEYLSFVVKFLLVMGVAFELPVVLLTIVKIGLLDHKQLSEFRHYFIVGMLVVSAVITPSGDPFTMVLVAVPLWILYEICVIIARIWYKRDQAEEARRAAES